jgi:hypothetical protein
LQRGAKGKALPQAATDAKKSSDVKAKK